ncbi:acyl carrier protein [Hyphococcus luteus]|uniref:Phosphopantetheine-binding protein n=1 Tax=Hyphococcus luteus TaxID=2058213 RepID=A0A2S7KA68_9PROT|nr:phosphopantetheine-binding protein [Marinicaulis flavus]PQA89395.1 phosphopantetheine-binding protein [Marinicaulis flavus]
MNKDDARKLIVEELGNIAPEADFDTIDAGADLMEELDIDSLDFLNFITALHKKTGVNVPESDYRKLATLDGAAAYLAEKTD